LYGRPESPAKSAFKARQAIVPGATTGIAHGRLGKTELEEVMLSFVAGTTDILLATTIIESGLDIPRANTIFIDEADGYGVTDLHQLRGRVGRSHHRAWCDLLVDETARLTQTAAKRLRAIQEFWLMARVEEEFPLECPGCGGDIRLIACITEPTPNYPWPLAGSIDTAEEDWPERL
jgi:ERCC4-related helicase